MASQRELWRYGASVAFEGLIAASDLLDDERYAAWAHGVLRGWAGRGPAFVERDNVAPGHAACTLAERTGDDVLVELAGALADFLLTRRQACGAYLSFERAPLREPYGGAVLPPEEQRLLEQPGAGVFLNAVHFGAAFLAHYGALTRQPRYVGAACDDLLAHLRLLQGEDGLLDHFWLESTGAAYGRGWGRGQAWALLGMIDTLAFVPDDDARLAELRARARRLADALAATQLPDGAWRAVVDDDESTAEVSTAAFATAAFLDGIALGVLPASFHEPAERAWSSVLASLSADGILEGVSVNVGACTALSHYAQTPRGAAVAWGQGPLLRAAACLGRAS